MIKQYAAAIALLTGFTQTVIAQPVLKITPSAVFSITGNATLTLQDMNLDNDAVINQSPVSSFLFTGSQNSSLSGNGLLRFNFLNIGKTGTAKLLLQQSVTIDSAINFISGLLDLSNNNIQLQPLALLNGESAGSHVVGAEGGVVTIDVNLNAPVAANPGNLGAVITAASNFGNTRIQRGHRSQTNTGGTGSSITRYYSILPDNNTGLNATLRFQYLEPELNGLDENLLVFYKNSDNIHWVETGVDSRNTGLHTVELTGINDFGKWTLSSGGNALPVRLIYFNAACVDNGAQLKWQTSNELDIGEFIVESSTDGSVWAMNKTVSGKGDAAGGHLYSMVDNTVNGTRFYRLVIKEKNGITSYSAVIKSNCNVNDNLLVQPNPVTDRLQIHVAVLAPSNSTMKLTNVYGQVVKEEQVYLQNGINTLHINMQQFAAGMYQLMITSPGNQYIKQIVKQ